MSFQINPQTAYNGMISGQRNMFLSSSIAFVILGFSEKFIHERTHLLVQLFGLGLLLLSIYIGFKSNHDMFMVVDFLKKEETIDEEKHFILDQALSWKWVVYAYSRMLVLLIIIYAFRKILIKKK
jgi:hypothetical protein